MNGAPSVTAGDRTFKYAEVRYGKNGPGNRGIRIWEDGVQGDHEYRLDPNPHLSHGYEKNKPLFYLQLAQAVADDVVAGGAWPAFGTTFHVEQADEDYTLVAP